MQILPAIPFFNSTNHYYICNLLADDLDHTTVLLRCSTSFSNSYLGTVTVVCSDYFLRLDALLMNQDTRQDMCEADTVN